MLIYKIYNNEVAVHIPRFLKIKRSKWRIIADKNAFDSKKLNGLCVFRTHQIFLDPDLPRNEFEVVFLHELLHAVFPIGVVGNRKEEELVEALSKGLHGVIKKNRLWRVGNKHRRHSRK